MISAFADADYPARFGLNSTVCAEKLATYVKQYDFDGVDVYYQDTYTFERGTAESWLIDFSTTLKDLLIDKTIVHTVDSKYFASNTYPNGGYMKIHEEIGDGIAFYNVKYFENEDSNYDTY